MPKRQAKPVETDVKEAAESSAADTPIKDVADKVSVETKPAGDEKPALPVFKLTHDGDSLSIPAVDEIAARAMFNDRRAKWPPPREVTCVRQ